MARRQRTPPTARSSAWTKSAQEHRRRFRGLRVGCTPSICLEVERILHAGEFVHPTGSANAISLQIDEIADVDRVYAPHTVQSCAVRTVFSPSSTTLPSASTSSAPKGWLPFARDRRASSMAASRWRSISFVTVSDHSSRPTRFRSDSPATAGWSHGGPSSSRKRMIVITALRPQSASAIPSGGSPPPVPSGRSEATARRAWRRLRGAQTSTGVACAAARGSARLALAPEEKTASNATDASDHRREALRPSLTVAGSALATLDHRALRSQRNR
jgi:hypothetical protein